MTGSVLSYWRDYFDPDSVAQFADHSTGLIASRLYGLMSAFGPVEYFDNSQRPSGLHADLFVGHFWSFESMCKSNDFEKKVAVYVLSNPNTARTLLGDAATRFGVPMPNWDLPPAGFDHDATMELADLVLLCGNQHTLATFSPRWRDKIRLFNYSLNEQKWPESHLTERSHNDFIYVATHCGLRKGFLDVIETWSEIAPDTARLHVLGHLDSPYDRLLAEANTGSVVVHGWINSNSSEYRDILRLSRYAYIPTWVEGQMGTMIEAIFAGCVPITTLACGIDDEVLAHCLIVDPLQPDAQRTVIEDVVDWSFEEWRARSELLQQVARRRQNWKVFDNAVGAALEGLLGTRTERTDEQHVAH